MYAGIKNRLCTPKDEIEYTDLPNYVDMKMKSFGANQGLINNYLAKVIYPKYSKHLPYTVARTIDCVCEIKC